MLDRYLSERNHHELALVTTNIFYFSKMPSCNDELEDECDDKDIENIKIENLKILKTIGTGTRCYINMSLIIFCI